jgi:hypothetical protein
VFFKQLYVLFAIEHEPRWAHLLGVTEHPDNGFVTQVARNLAGGLAEACRPMKFVIRDRGTKFTASFDEVFRSEAVEVIKTPVRAPRANTHAERSVRTVRTECLDWPWYSGGATLKRSSASTSSTTTRSVPIVASASTCRPVGPAPRSRCR